jgi:hypothetical protein
LASTITSELPARGCWIEVDGNRADLKIGAAQVNSWNMSAGKHLFAVGCSGRDFGAYPKPWNVESRASETIAVEFNAKRLRAS